MKIGFISLAISGFIFNRGMLHETRFALTSAIGINMTGILCGMMFCFGIIDLTNKCVSKRYKLLSLMSFTLSSFVGVITASKTFFVMAVVTLAVMSLVNIKNPKMFVRNIFILIIIMVIGWFFVNNNKYIQEDKFESLAFRRKKKIKHILNRAGLLNYYRKIRKR